VWSAKISRRSGRARSAAEKGGFDLLVIGVMFRPSNRRLYFGPKVEYVLRNARCAFVVVVTPEKPSRALGLCVANC
jgi:nucleotide-binding universal stress UspA family protein